MSNSDIFKLFTFASTLGAAMSDVEDFNERMDEAEVGDEVALDIPDTHEPRWPARLKGNHKARVSQIIFRKES